MFRLCLCLCGHVCTYLVGLLYVCVCMQGDLFLWAQSVSVYILGVGLTQSVEFLPVVVARHA